MDAKLTLNLNKAIIEKAKVYAKEKHISLSRLIESYLSSIVKEDANDDEIEIPDAIRSLRGIVKVDKDYNFKEDYTKYLEEKYK